MNASLYRHAHRVTEITLRFCIFVWCVFCFKMNLSDEIFRNSLFLLIGL